MSLFTKKPIASEDAIRTQVTQSLLVYLLVVQVLVIVPHLIQLPIWLFAVWFAIAIWRWQIARGSWNLPVSWVKASLVFISCAGLYISFGAKPSFDAMMSLLVIGFSLKMLELETRRDILLLLYLALFILACFFIIENNFSAVLYVLLPSLFLFHLLMQLQKVNVSEGIQFKDLRQVMLIILMAVPLLIVLFVVMPRLGSFWSVPSPQQAQTGLNDQLAPGTISNLMESNELAFRATFETAIPERKQRYWRSLVLNFFDGRVWRESSRHRSQILVNSSELMEKDSNAELVYDIIMEPSGQQWLVALMVPLEWSEAVQVDKSFTFTSRDILNQRIAYRVRSANSARVIKTSPQELTENLQLPASGNEQSRSRAKEWLTLEGSPEGLSQKILSFYRESFYYTMQPAALQSKDIVDSFLFGTKQGYCEYFASSYVFLMRAAGVPARIVIGYQGGEVNQEGSYISVYQRHAHAWAEIYIEAKGWVLVDPTAAVAPERVLKSPEESLPATDRDRIKKPFYSRLSLISSTLQYWDDLNYQWVKWVMNFDSDSQEQLLSQWLGEVNLVRLAGFVLGAGVLGFAGLWVFNSPSRVRPASAEQMVFHLLCKKLAAGGYVHTPSEAPLEFLVRVRQQCHQLEKPLAEVAAIYEEVFYAEKVERLTELKRAIRSLNTKKPKNDIG